MTGDSLVVVSGPAAGTRIDVAGELVIGRSEQGPGCLGSDPTISRRHAQITRSAEGLTLQDLGSTNGTYLNGQRVSAPARLRPGDSIRVGGSTIEVTAPSVAGSASGTAEMSTPPPPPPPEMAPVSTQPAHKLRPTWFAALGALIIIGVFFATRGDGSGSAPSSNDVPGIDGTAYVETNVAHSGQNSVLAFRYHFGSFRPMQVVKYRTGGSGSADLNNAGVLDADQQVIVNARNTLLFAVNQGSDSIAVFHIAANRTLTAVAGSPFASGGIAPASVGISGNVLIVANKAHDGVRALARVAPNYATMLVNDDGTLRPTGFTVPLPPGSSPTQVYVAPGGRLVFTTEESGLTRAFMLDSSGRLSEVPGSPLDLPDSLFGSRPRPNPVWPAGLSANPTASVLYSGVPNDNSIVAFDYGPNGRLSIDTGAVDPRAKLPCWSVVSADGRHLYFANAGSDNVSVWDVGTNPRHPLLLQTVALRGGGNPWNLRLDPVARFLYIITPRQIRQIPVGDGQLLHTLRVAGDGTLTELADSPIPIPVARDTNPLGLAIVPAR